MATITKPARIQKLTPDQIAALPRFRDRGLAIGLSTIPCDRAAGAEAIKAHYRALGRPEPRIIIWLDSPREGAVGAAMLAGSRIAGDQVGDQVRAQVRDQVWDQVWDQVGAQVRAQVRDQVWDQVRAQVRAQVRDQVGDQVGAQVRDQVRAQVRDQVWDQVGAQVRDQVRAQVRAQVRDQVWDQVYFKAAYGGHDMEWAAWAAAMLEFGVKLPAGGETLIRICETVGWWWPFENAVILTDRPTLLNRDTRNRLHSTTGPAIAYRDGFAIHAVSGVRVSEWLIAEPERLTPKAIRAETNTEIRRVMVRLYGERHRGSNWIDELGGKVIDSAGADDPRVGLRTGRLIRIRDDAGSYHMIDVLNSSPEPDGTVKRYQLVVNGEHYGGMAGTSLLAAWASTYRDPRDPSRLAFARPEDALFAMES